MVCRTRQARAGSKLLRTVLRSEFRGHSIVVWEQVVHNVRKALVSYHLCCHVVKFLGSLCILCDGIRDSRLSGVVKMEHQTALVRRPNICRCVHTGEAGPACVSRQMMAAGSNAGTSAAKDQSKLDSHAKPRPVMEGSLSVFVSDTAPFSGDCPHTWLNNDNPTVSGLL